MTAYEELINQAYWAFNARDIDTALALLQTDVHWPNAWEGGYLDGHEAVRTYWVRQWQELDPIVTPVSFRPMPDGQIEVVVHQRIKDLHGNVLVDFLVHHVYTLEAGKIKSMTIHNP